MKIVWRIRLFSYTLLTLLFLSSSAFAEPFNCHAYTLFQLTGIKSQFGQNMTRLTSWLKTKGYSRRSFPAGTDWKTVDTWLKDGDVITISSAHSGVVVRGRIHHFTKASTTFKTASKENVDTLQSLMNKEVVVEGDIHNSWSGVTYLSTRHIYKDKPVVLWRKTSPEVRQDKLKKGVPCRGPADGEIGAWMQDSNGCYNIPRKRKKRTKFEDSHPNVKGEGMFGNPYGTTPGFNW